MGLTGDSAIILQNRENIVTRVCYLNNYSRDLLLLATHRATMPTAASVRVSDTDDTVRALLRISGDFGAKSGDMTPALTTSTSLPRPD